MRRTVHIARPQPQLYDYLANLNNVAEYIGPVQRFHRWSTTELEVGTRVTVDVQFLGITFSQRAECYEHTRPLNFAARSVGGRFFFEAGFDLKTEGPNTVLDGWGRAQAPRLFGLAEPILGFFIERQIDGDLKRLKRRLEAGEVG